MEKNKFRADKALRTAQKQTRNSLIFLLLVISMGTIGYSILEDWNILDSLYMTVISITTTGFREVMPLSSEGKVFTIFIIITGFSAVAYSAARAAQFIFEQGLLWRRKMKKKIVNLKGHTIVCGFGRMGKEICRVLEMNKSPFVVIDQSEEAIDDLLQIEYPFIEGDANEDSYLSLAGIERASALIAVLSSDADNVFTVLTARGMNPKLKILARAVSESSERKLLKAGADKVILPYLLGGQRIAQSLLKPGVMDFFEMFSIESKLDIKLEQIILNENSELVGLELGSTFIRSDLDVIIVTIIRNNGSIVYNPKSKTVLEPGDKLLAIGHMDGLKVLEEIS